MADGHANKHDYHLVNPSPWPALGSLGAFVLALGAVKYFVDAKAGEPSLMPLVPGFAIVLATMYFWWRDCIREAHAGDHTPVVSLHLRYGMIMFIASEVMFFVAWFWAFFDASLVPSGLAPIGDTANEVGRTARDALTGGAWPPQPVEDKFEKVFDPWGLPLVNTLILLLSGTTVTWAHHALLEDDRQGLIWGLAATVGLGVLFTALQVYEYGHAAFSFSGHIYGATFFMATGFHGFHVFVGTIFLAVCLWRAVKGHFTQKQHFGFEAAAWYWHFVDVVWLFLFAAVYIWAS
ncbi:MAG: cytochrome c oxidase subunit 3 [Pseudomonadota bacterium]